MNLSDSVTRWIRTVVPLGVGFALTWLASSLHIVVGPSSQAGLTALCVTVTTAGYYSLARWVEKRWPKVGIVLLGAPAKPFEPPATTPTP